MKHLRLLTLLALPLIGIGATSYVSTNETSVSINVLGNDSENMGWTANWFVTYSTNGAAGEAAPPTVLDLTNGLWSYWTLDDAGQTTSSNSAPDKSAYTLSENGTVGNAAGLRGNSADFNGAAANYLSRADSTNYSAIDSNSITIVFWTSLDRTNAANWLLNKDASTPSGSREYNLLWSSTANTFRIQVLTNSTSDAAVATATSSNIDIGGWYLVAAAIDSTNWVAKILWSSTNASDIAGIQWVDSSAFSGFGPSGQGTNTTAPFEVGKFGASQTADCRIDELGVWGRVLSLDEIKAYWTNTMAGRQGWINE